MRIQFYRIALIVLALVVLAPGISLWSADDRNAMETIDGAIIEERAVQPSDSKLADADATYPDGMPQPPAPETQPEKDAEPADVKEEGAAPPESQIKIDEAMVEKIIPSYTFGIKKLMKNAEKRIEKINKELARREKLKKKDAPDGAQTDAAREIIPKRPTNTPQNEKPARKKCGIEPKNRTNDRRFMRDCVGIKDRARMKTAYMSLRYFKGAGMPVRGGRMLRLADSRTGCHIAGGGAALAEDDTLLMTHERQLLQIKKEQDRFAGERSRHINKVPEVSETEMLSREARQQEELKCEQERFARERARYVTKVPAVKSEDLVRTWEKYGVITKGELEREREYIKEEKRPD